MIKLVTNQQSLYDSFQKVSVEDSLKELEKMEFIGVDLETEGFDPFQDHILTMQLGDYNTQFYIDNSINFTSYKDLLENKFLILQNAQFDHRFLYRLGIYPLKIWDTFIAEKILTLGLDYSPKNLEALADKYLGKENHDISKDLRGSFHSLGIYSETSIKYGANDVKYLFAIMAAQCDQAEKWGVLKAIELENRFTPALAYIAYSGLYVDPDKWSDKVNNAKLLLNKSYNNLDEWYINNDKQFTDKSGQLSLFSEELCPVKWSSSDQVIPILEQEGVNVWTIEKGEKKKSSGEKHLSRYKGKFKIVDLLLKYRHWQTDVTKYGLNFLRFIHKETNRIHTTFNQVLLTGRISSGKRKKGKTDEEAYPNLQNIPSDDTRKCFTPQKKDNSLVYCDYSQQEDIVFVNFSKESKLIEFYQRPGKNDGHALVAKMTFQEELKAIEEKDVKDKAPELRQRSKSVKFAIHYGGDGYTISNNLGISKEEGDRIFNSYLEGFPDIKEYFKTCEQDALKLGYILISPITGKKIFLTDLSKEVVGFKPQFFHNFNHWKESGKLLNRKFWTMYRIEKEKDSKWFQEKKKKVKEYFKIKSSIRKLSLNAPIQGSSAEITKKAATDLFHWIVENNYQDIVLMINMIHDEIGTEQPKSMAKMVAEKLQYFMEKAGEEYCPIIPLSAIPEITDYWKH